MGLCIGNLEIHDHPLKVIFFIPLGILKHLTSANYWNYPRVTKDGWYSSVVKVFIFKFQPISKSLLNTYYMSIDLGVTKKLMRQLAGAYVFTLVARVDSSVLVTG